MCSSYMENVFEDLGFSPEEAAGLTLKADLHSRVVKRAAGYSQKQLQTILDEPQPRVSDLLRGKMSKFNTRSEVHEFEAPVSSSQSTI